jgi:hypothetical protein
MVQNHVTKRRRLATANSLPPRKRVSFSPYVKTHLPINLLQCTPPRSPSLSPPGSPSHFTDHHELVGYNIKFRYKGQPPCPPSESESESEDTDVTSSSEESSDEEEIKITSPPATGSKYTISAGARKEKMALSARFENLKNAHRGWCDFELRWKKLHDQHQKFLEMLETQRRRWKEGKEGCEWEMGVIRRKMMKLKGEVVERQGMAEDVATTALHSEFGPDDFGGGVLGVVANANVDRKVGLGGLKRKTMRDE